MYNCVCYSLLVEHKNMDVDCQVEAGHGKLDLLIKMKDDVGKLIKNIIFEIKVLATSSNYSDIDSKFAEAIKNLENKAYNQVLAKDYNKNLEPSSTVIVSLICYNKQIVYYKSYLDPLDPSNVLEEEFLSNIGKKSNEQLRNSSDKRSLKRMIIKSTQARQPKKKNLLKK